MRKRTTLGARAGAGLALWCVLALAACTPQQPDGGQGNCTGICNSDFNFGGPSGVNPSPSPGAGGTLPAGAFLRAGFFGISCPAGTTAPNNGLRELPQNCRGFMTVTPKYQDGSDIPASVHGPNCTWEVTSGAGTVNLATTGENFNRDATCNGVGPWSIKNTVLNVTADSSYSCTAVAGARSSSTRERDYYWADWASQDMRADAIAREQALLRSSTSCATCR